ncbi:hypothetical protein ACFSKU_10825, partial [Pontibacter silvestris]
SLHDNCSKLKVFLYFKTVLFTGELTGEGKSKMSVINAVRNKLLHQIVAVIKRGTPYEIRLNKI